MGRLGLTEILIILAVALLLFGGNKIGDIGKGLGEGIRNFKRGLREDDEPAPPVTGAPTQGQEKNPPPGSTDKT